MALTDLDLERYERDGYIVLEPSFGAAELDELRREADRLVELQLSVSLGLGEPSPRLDASRRNGHVAVRKLQPVADLSPAFASLAADERLLAPLRQLLGCEPVLMEEKLNVKQPVTLDDRLRKLPLREGDEAFEFHTDIAYFWLDGYPRTTLSSAIALDDCTVDNGPLRVVPGSHRRDWPHREGWPPVLADGAVDDAEVVDLLVPAGTVMVFHSALVHSSRANDTDAPRRLMIYSHFPSTHSMEPDARNRDLRHRGQEAERRYDELLARGAVTPWTM